MKTRCSIARRSSTWWAAFGIWFILLWVLSSQSPRDLPSPRIPHLDKLAHAFYFACGATLLACAFALAEHARSALSRLPWRPVAFVLLAAIGALDEWHQTFTPGRHGADPWDWLADLAGSALGIALVSVLARKRRSRLGLAAPE